MGDTRVKFSTAMLAQEKGYDIETYADCWVKTLDGRIIHNSERRSTPEDDRCETYCLQPTQTGLQKWLREVKRIEMYVEPYYDINGKVLYCPWVVDNTIEEADEPVYYDVWEDAMEEGLVEALKLIK